MTIIVIMSTTPALFTSTSCKLFPGTIHCLEEFSHPRYIWRIMLYPMRSEHIYSKHDDITLKTKPNFKYKEKKESPCRVLGVCYQETLVIQ